MADDNDPCIRLEYLFLKLASLSDDVKLSQFVSAHLFEILQLMSLNGDEAQTKGMELLNHLNRRIKDNKAVVMPIAELLTYLALPSKERNTMISNFSVVYTKMAFRQIDDELCFGMFPSFLDAIIANLNDNQLSNQLITLIPRICIIISKLLNNGSLSFEQFGNQELRKLVLQFFTDILFFQDFGADHREASEVDSFPCMSKNRYLRISTGVLSDSEIKITQLKLAVIMTATSGIFKDVEIFPMLIGAMTFGPDKVMMSAEKEMKRLDLKTILQDKIAVTKLFDLYLGGENKNVSDADKTQPASMPIKLKILPFLLRSEVAAKMFPLNIKVAFNGLFDKPVSGSIPLKLQQESILFLQRIVENGSDAFFATIGPVIFCSLRKLINENEHVGVVSVAYNCLGIIGCKLPKLIVNDLTLMKETFEALPKAPDGISEAISSCLLTWLPAFRQINDTVVAGNVEPIIITYIEHESSTCRMISLKYVEAFIKLPSMDTRWLLCYTCGDSHEEIRKEAIKILDFSLSDPKFLLDIKNLVHFFHRRLKIDDSAKSTADNVKDKDSYSHEIYRMSALYLYAVVRCACDENTSSLSEIAVEPCLPSHGKIIEYLKQLHITHPQIMQQFINIVCRSIKAQPDEVSIDIAIVLMNCGGGSMSNADRNMHIAVLSGYLKFASHKGLHKSIAELYVQMFDESHLGIVMELCSELEKIDAIDGSLPWICASFVSYSSLSISAEIVNNVRKSLVNLINKNFDDSSTTLEAAIGSLSLLLRRALVVGGKEGLRSLVTEEELLYTMELVGKIACSRKDTLSSKTKEFAVKCLGFMLPIETTPSLSEKLSTLIYDVGEVAAQPELQFTVGDALFDVAFGQFSTSRRNQLAETEKDFLANNVSDDTMKVIEKRLENLLQKVMLEKLQHPNRHVRQSALIWLFVLAKRCASLQLNAVKNASKQIQNAFINGLTEANEFLQDVASKGIGVIFELGDEAQKKLLVEGLVDALSLGRKQAHPISADTQLFSKGELGTSPSGEQLTTYRELCSLATDLNQPDLIYKFMQLSNHHALWNSRKGAAFGFSTVLQRARDELEPYFSRIVPKLYRYQYDPDWKVRGSMRSIWLELTNSKKNVIETYANEIFSELLSSLVDKQWRVRESSCLALSDLISANSHKKMLERFGELYAILFRLQDDVKESVRTAATRTLTTLTKTTLNLCTTGNRESANHLIGIVLPIIIEKGIKSTVKANAMISLKLIIDITKEASSALQQHLVAIIPCLLESLSETEPALLNYLATRSTSDEMEVLDSARTFAAHTSPMMSALNDIVPYVDEQAFNSLSGKLCDQLRSGVGLSTRTGTSQFIIDLCMRQQLLLGSTKSTNDKILRALLHSINDRNPTIRKNFSTAISYIIQFCSQTESARLIENIKQHLVNDEQDKGSVLHLLRALSRNSEILSSVATSVVPYVFLQICREVSKDDQDGKKALEMWKELWYELVPETESAMRMYRKEIIEVAVNTLVNSSVWSLKAQAATVLSKIASSSSSIITKSESECLFETLTNLLQGRIWTGKEKILQALTILLKARSSHFSSLWSHDEVQERFVPIWKECQKKDMRYSSEALTCAAQFCETIKNDEISLKVFERIESIIECRGKLSDGEESEDGEKGQERSSNLNYQKLARGVQLMAETLELSDIYWKVKQSLIVEMPYFVERIDKCIDFTKVFNAIAQLLLDNESQRRSFADQCGTVLERIAKRVSSSASNETMFTLNPNDQIMQLLKRSIIVKSLKMVSNILSVQNG